MKKTSKAMGRGLWLVLGWLGGRLLQQELRRRRSRQVKVVDQAFVSRLAKADYTLGGDVMEPINLLLVARSDDLQRVFTDSGWHDADPVTPWTLFKSLVALIFSLPYPRGPITPLFVHDQPQDLSLQKPTEHRSFRRRHHIRIWQTDYTLADGRPVWIASATYDRGAKLMWRLPFITHAIDPNLDQEREVVAADLIGAGASRTGDYQFLTPGKAKSAYGDAYHSDGRLVALEV